MGRDGIAYKERSRDSSLCAWTLYFTVLKTTTALKYEATVFLYATSLAQHISHSAFCHITPTDLVLIPLEYYTIRCWARRKKSQSWMVKETRDSCFLHPRLFPPSTVHALIFLFKSLEVPFALDCVKDCTLFPTAGTHFCRWKLWWIHFYTLNINIRSQKEYQVKEAWCITDILSRVGQCADLISVVCTKSMTSNPANGKSEHRTNSLHLFIHVFKHLTNRK